MQFSRFRVLTLAAAALALALGLSPARAVEPKYLPPDTEVIISVNVRQMLQSEVAKAHKGELLQLRKMLEEKLAEKNVLKYFERAGFDPFQDLKSVTVAGPGAKDAEAGFVLIEGKFDPEKVSATLKDVSQKSGDVKAVQVGGIQAYEITPKGEKTMYAGLVGNDKLVATASKDAFAAAVARVKGGGRSGDLKKNVKQLLQAVGPKHSLAIVATGPALSRLAENPQIPNAEAAAAGLQAVEGLAFVVTLDKNVNYQLTVQTKDQKTAEEYAKAGTGFLFMAKAMAQKKAEENPKVAPALDVINNLRITSQENNLVVRGEITLATLEKILQNLPKQR